VKTKYLATFGLVALMLSGCSGLKTPTQAEPSPSDTPAATSAEARLSAAQGAFGLRYEEGAELGDAGESLTLDGAGDEDFTGLPYSAVACVLNELEVPDATLNLVETTRALDGRQTASWDGFDATWSYHPDTGMNVTLVDSEFEN